MKLKKILLISAVFIAIVFTGSFFLLKRVPVAEVKSFGVTFSKIQAERLGLDWQEAYLAILNDLEIKKIRIPVYWQEVEAQKDAFNFVSIDWMVEKAEEHEAEIILAVGRKLPRWPECHEPEWVQSQNANLKSQKLLDYIKKTIERYDTHPAVWAWQVENEPFLRFGECPHSEIKKNLDEEIALVRFLSDKPIIITDGGEFGDWFRAYKRADIFGSTMYRHVYGEWFGEITYPIPSFFFRLKHGLVELFYDKKPSLVIELQAEPWGDKLIEETDIDEQLRLFGPERFGEMMEYIKGTGFDTFYLWGAEWWYLLKEKGHPEMWEAVKDMIK